jgi:mannose-6-phosphate isomerase-like protein (cupin superfamily)
VKVNDMSSASSPASHASQSAIEAIAHQGQTLAIIIRAGHRRDGIEFLTPPAFSQQLAYMRRPQGYVIDPHVHNRVIREIHYTHEVLFIRRGRLRVDFFSDARQYVESRVLTDGDVILLAGGGHGFEMLEETEIIEVKQGPYDGEKDKTRFEPSAPFTPVCR